MMLSFSFFTFFSRALKPPKMANILTADYSLEGINTVDYSSVNLKSDKFTVDYLSIISLLNYSTVEMNSFVRLFCCCFVVVLLLFCCFWGVFP